ncbi:MAG: hypothetical protein JO048_06650 [Methylobacteriaceae bacterium]|nr:hypothetical protein [Methylobacteriaceae bacterium]
MPEPAPRLNIWDDHWDFRPEDCPCDVDFVRWLDREGIRDAAIYHFGSGGHHHVGIECARPDRRNSVLAITAAPREHESFVQLALARPELLRFYSAVFGDIYLVNARLLPELDVATLFHLCEFRSARNDAYGALDDLAVTQVVASRIRPGGHLLFFPGSFAWDRANDSAKDVVAAWAAESDFTEIGRFGSLLVYRRAGGGAELAPPH